MKHPCESEQITIANGVTSAIAMMMYAICNNGEKVLLPAPYYSALPNDFNTLFGAIPCIVDGQISKHTLETAYRANPSTKALFLTNPSNPLGDILSSEKLDEIVQWCVSRDIHLISDEIYALGSWNGNFLSAAKYMDDYPEHVHILYGMSKDLAIAGFRCGCIYSRNRNLINES